MQLGLHLSQRCVQRCCIKAHQYVTGVDMLVFFNQYLNNSSGNLGADINIILCAQGAGSRNSFYNITFFYFAHLNSSSRNLRALIIFIATIAACEQNRSCYEDIFILFHETHHFASLIIKYIPLLL